VYTVLYIITGYGKTGYLLKGTLLFAQTALEELQEAMVCHEGYRIPAI